MLGGANEVIACWILLGSFLVLLLIRVPISFTLAISSLATIIYLRLPFQVVAQKMSDGMDTFALMAIPFFVLAGEIMARGGMARKLVDFARLLVGWLPGGLAVVRDFRLQCGRYFRNWLHPDSSNAGAGLSSGLCHQPDHHCQHPGDYHSPFS